MWLLIRAKAPVCRWPEANYSARRWRGRDTSPPCSPPNVTSAFPLIGGEWLRFTGSDGCQCHITALRRK